jgi:uncharacterized protein
LSLVFADTAFHVAVIDRRDNGHAAALSVAGALRAENTGFVTTDAVLVEFLTYFSAHGESIRRAAADYVTLLKDDELVTVVPQTPTLFDPGLELYRRRPDKGYSMCDCMSMVVCTQLQISEVLTSDRDFEQQGFKILL